LKSIFSEDWHSFRKKQRFSLPLELIFRIFFRMSIYFLDSPFFCVECWFMESKMKAESVARSRLMAEKEILTIRLSQLNVKKIKEEVLLRI